MPDVGRMVPIASILSPAVTALAERASEFLRSHSWCKEVTETYLSWALTPPVAVFLIRFVPVFDQVDKELWVIVGDLPSAYIVCDNANTWQEALDAYGVEVMRWVDAVRSGSRTDNLIPVNAPPTLEFAAMLESRIKFIWEEFVDHPIDTYPSEI